MCTLTVAPLEDRVRLAFNRDEQRGRPVALPPRLMRLGGREAILPTDRPSGGAWLAVNDAGLAIALLNANPKETRTYSPRRSRGEVIPSLLSVSSTADALRTLEHSIRFADFAPFRLVLVGDGLVADVHWDGRQPMVMNRLLGGTPLMFTSSGLGDHLVECVRRELFEQMFAGPADGWEAAQDAFHRHRWPGREHLSVNMSRADARTVSHAIVELSDSEAAFAYLEDAPDEPAARHELRLSLSPVGVA